MPQKPCLRRVPLRKKQTRQEQYEMLRPYYDEEASRYDALSKRAASYLSVLGVVSTFAVFKVEEVAKLMQADKHLTAIAGAMLLCVLACVLLIANAVRIRDYRTPVDPRTFVLKAESQAFTSEDSYSELLAGLVASIEHNRAANNRTAGLLKWSLWFGAAAITLFLAINVALLLKPIGGKTMATSDKNQPSNTPVPSASPAPAATPAPSPASTSMADLLSQQSSVVVQKGTTVPEKRASVAPLQPDKPASGGE